MNQESQEKLMETEMKTILDALLSGIVVIDAQTHEIVELNPVAAKLIGAPAEQIIGHVCHQFICPAEKGKCPITDLGQKVDNSERVLLKSDGSGKVPIIKTVIPVILKGREYLLENFFDYTEQKKKQEELQLKTEELEQTNKLMIGRELKMIELKKELEKLNSKPNA